MLSAILHGSYFSYNYGDYVFCELFVDEIINTKKYEKILLPTASEVYFRLLNRNLETKINKIRSFFSTDIFIYGPGGYFGEPPKNKYKWNLKMILSHLLPGLIMRLRGVPYCIIGVGAGPISNIIAQKLVSFIFNGAKIISVRDDEFRVYLSKYGVKKGINVVVDAAIVCREKFNTEKSDARALSILDKLTNKRKVFLNINMTTKDDRKFLLAKEISKFAFNHDDLAFILGSDNDSLNQKEFINDFLTFMPEERSIAFIDNDPHLLTSILKFVDVTITTKLHVGIISVAFNKSVISFAEHTKTKRFYRQIGESERCIDIENINSENILFLLNKYVYSDFVLADQFRASSAKNFQILNKFLNDYAL